MNVLAYGLSPIASMLPVMTGQPDEGDNGILEAGDSIAYKINVSNTGNTCLRTLTISDLLVRSSISCDNTGTGLSIAQ